MEPKGTGEAGPLILLYLVFALYPPGQEQDNTRLLLQSLVTQDSNTYSQEKGSTLIQRSTITFSRREIQERHLPKRSSLNSCFTPSRFETSAFNEGGVSC